MGSKSRNRKTNINPLIIYFSLCAIALILVVIYKNSSNHEYDNNVKNIVSELNKKCPLLITPDIRIDRVSISASSKREIVYYCTSCDIFDKIIHDTDALNDSTILNRKLVALHSFYDEMLSAFVEESKEAEFYNDNKVLWKFRYFNNGKQILNNFADPNPDEDEPDDESDPFPVSP